MASDIFSSEEVFHSAATAPQERQTASPYAQKARLL